MPRAEGKRPNVLWITFEDTSPQFIGCYGATDASTPRLDALAGEGVRFERSYSVGTVCAPSRSTLLTGCPTTRLGTGHHRSDYPIPPSITGFPTYLRRAGYFTTNNVKTDYNTSEHDRLVEESWDDCSNTAGWWGREPGQPFFSVFNLMTSHQKWTMTLPYEDYERVILKALPEAERVAPDDIDMPPFLRDTPTMRRHVSRIHNSLALTDRQIGALLDRLDADRLADDTIVFVFADHGEGMPRGKTNGIGLGYRVPMVVRVPERWRHLLPWAGEDVVVHGVVSFEDLPPTVLELCGLDVPEHLTGRSLVGAEESTWRQVAYGASDRADDSTDCERAVMLGDYLYTRRLMPFQPELRWMEYHDISEIRTQIRADLAAGLLTPEQSQPFDPRTAEGLFDLGRDPWELDNLVDDPDEGEVLDAARTALRQRLIDQPDVMLLPEYELAEISRTSTPYEAAEADPGRLAEVADIAMLSGMLDGQTLTRQLEALTATWGPVRYWALTGIRSHGEVVVESHRDLVHVLLDDPYPPVAILAAGILHSWWGVEEASRRLRSACSSTDPRVVLMALEQVHASPVLASFADAVTDIPPDGRDSAVLAARGLLLYRAGRAALPVRHFTGEAVG